MLNLNLGANILRTLSASWCFELAKLDVCLSDGQLEPFRIIAAPLLPEGVILLSGHGVPGPLYSLPSSLLSAGPAPPSSLSYLDAPALKP